MRSLGVGREALGVSAQGEAALRALIRLPADELALRWVTTVLHHPYYHPPHVGESSDATATAATTRVENFGTDWAVRGSAGCGFRAVGFTAAC